MTTTRLIDHQHRRTYYLATQWFDNDSSAPAPYALPTLLFVPYAALSQFWWFVGWQAMLAGLAFFWVVYLVYAVALKRATLASVYERNDRSRTIAIDSAQTVQSVYHRLPAELRDTLDDSLSFCYRAIKLEEYEQIEPRRSAALSLLEAWKTSSRLGLGSTDDLERVNAVTKALNEQKSVQAA